LREDRWTTEDLGPVARQSGHMLGVAWMGERVVQHRILQTPLVVRGRKRKECRRAAGELENRRSRYRHRFTLPQR
jgi:hypothetical protein